MDGGKLNVNIFIPHLVGGGAERVVSELSLNQSPDINLSISLNSLKNMAYQIGEVQLFAYDENASKNILSKILFSIKPRIIYQTYQHYLHIRRNKFDVSVSFLTYANVTNILVSGLLHVPTVISIRNNILEEHGNSILSSIQKYFLKVFSPYVIVNSEDNKNWLVHQYHLNNDKCICIYNPKDVRTIQSLSTIPVEEDFCKTEEPILLSVGRLVPQKGHMHLLRIFRRIREDISCRLVICGIGPLESTLKEMVMKMNLSNSVYFAGFCENPYKYMKRADIFVLTSLFEGQPNALIEALICGCPIISTDCNYGPREILDNGKYGFLTQRLDGKIENPLTMPLTNAESEMCEKIMYLMLHPEKREELKLLSSERIPLFNKDMCIKKYYDVFHAALDNKSLNDIE